MLNVTHLCKAYGPKTLFQDASLRVLRGERIGLVGPNGAGKSTLFGIVLGTCEADAGTVELERGASIGFLPQESAPAGDESVLDLASSISEEMSQTLALLRTLPEGSDAPARLEAQEAFAALDGHGIQARAKRILAGLAFRERDFHAPARTLSGGWIMRAHLARLLVMEPDLLLLDEPTNHLDLETLGWFQAHLARYPGALLTISHDRAFLNRLCNSIVEIHRGKVTRYTGHYDAYLVQRAQRIEQQRAAWQNQQREIAHLKDFINRFGAKATKAAQAQSRVKRLEKMDLLEAPDERVSTVHFRFPEPPRSAQKVAVLEGVTQAYGEHVVYRHLDLTVERGQRTVLVGPNGAGKSTLLKLLAGLVPIQAGQRTLGQNVSVGYFSQQRTEMLDVTRTALDEAMQDIPHGLTVESVRTLLGAFLFRGDDVFKPVGVLSGGEKSRLALVKLLLAPPNFLLLDEPTTHLDMTSIDALIHALAKYPGALMFVSHDVHFIRAVATTVWHVHGGKLTPYAGDYDYYLYKSGASSEQGGLVAGLGDARPQATSVPTAGAASAVASPKERRRAEALKRQTLAGERKQLEARVARLEAEIMAMEQRQAALSEALESRAAYADPEQARTLRREAMDVAARLQEANLQWEQAADALAGH